MCFRWVNDSPNGRGANWAPGQPMFSVRALLAYFPVFACKPSAEGVKKCAAFWAQLPARSPARPADSGFPVS